MFYYYKFNLLTYLEKSIILIIMLDTYFDRRFEPLLSLMTVLVNYCVQAIDIFKKKRKGLFYVIKYRKTSLKHRKMYI